MKKSYIVIGVIIVIVIGIFMWFKGSYNQMVTRSENVSSQWSNVENQYQRRLDLIPNLVNTVKGYAEHEQNTLTQVVEARAKATLAQAEAEAKAIQLKLEAEAEGKKKSLLAEAEGFEAMVRAAESNPAIAIQYKMVDQWKEIAGEQVKAFEHINLGNITVFDGGNGGTSNFLNTLVKTVAPSLGVLDKLPIGETVKGIINPESKTEEKPAGKTEEKKK